MATALAPASTGQDGAEPAVRHYSQQSIHLLRTMQLNNTSLSRMADQKASILMGATFVVFSLAVGRTVSAGLSYPLMVLGVFAFASSLCAVAAVMPSVTSPSTAPEKVNRLFFGHFALLDEHEWAESLLDEMQTDDRLFHLMLHDIHQHGQVLLKRKYRYLGYAYGVFVAGLIVTLFVFAIVEFA